MARLPSSVRTNNEDVKGAEPWFFRFLSIQNTVNQALYEALDGHVTFTENIQCQIKEMTFTTLSTYSAGDFTNISFLKLLKVKAMGFFLLQIYKFDNQDVSLKNGVSADWLDVNGNIIIRYISGLEDETKYFFRAMVI